MSDIARKINKERLAELLAAESQHSRVFVPRQANGDTEFAPFGDGVEPALQSAPPRRSPKAFFFPQTETLYKFDVDTIEESADEVDDRKPVVLFGIRPCDSASFELLDQVFGPENHGYPDPYYQQGREETVVVSFACNTPCATCFCTTVGGDPAGRRGADVLATDLDTSVLLEGVTEKGILFLERNAALLAEPAKKDREAAESLAETARKLVQRVAYDRDQTKKNLDEQFDMPIWEKITNSCIGCGACTYLCPTCHCFDICDEERHYKGRRIRTWDSCQYAQFTKHASGHNPRPTKTQRLRQRFMHKFSYTVETVDEIYCVGCGRCIKYCPVNLDIREVLREFSS